MIRLKSLLNKYIISEADDKSKPRVLFVGDSQTFAPWSYARQLIKKGVVTGKVVAKNGASTSEVLKMVRDHLSDEVPYDIVSIMAGGNDGAAKTPFNAIKNFQSMFELVRKYGCKLVVITNPSKQFVKKGDTYYREGGYPSNDAIAKWLKTQAPADVIINTQLFDNVDFVKDHVHLDSDAHTHIANEWKQNALNLASAGDISGPIERSDVLIVQGDSGPEVKEMQSRLIILGYNVGPNKADGKFGPATEKALKAFQRDSGLEITGIYDSATDSRLETKTMGAPVRQTKNSDISLRNLLRGVIGIDANYDDDIETQAADIIRKFEGLSYTPYWDVNNWRIGYGSSTVTDMFGNVTKLSDDKSNKPEITITDKDAERDLDRRLTDEFIPKVMNSIGSANLPDGAIAALTSVCYNYGSLPSSVSKAAKTGNLEKIARAVLNLRSHNGGILADRREQEAAYILNSK